ncbi:MAG TPA: type I 3-dehydroquinate dehydratase [Chthoniobacterales bacterium]|nr:type I 3-dehydroquinate dehydratase [Chthoniobacterales bacterium]
MPARKPVKTWTTKVRLVAVITDAKDLGFATAMSSPPDLFELRLDCLADQPNLERRIRRLPSPVIITARHPAEGGRHNLSGPVRRELLLRFLPLAQYVDLELRSARTGRMVLDSARRLGVNTIISFHDLNNTPRLGSLRAKSRQAARLGAAVFKVATRSDTPDQLGRLLQFASENQRAIPVAVMGIGRLGAVSRLLLAQCGSILAYTALRESQIEGQLSVKAFRNALRHISGQA